ncbi:MAG: response regulator, partial [Candidatus Coatesbacteria bacterium]|nr:response regulator [Candidatus Coatesbacteria bacterium]
HALLILERESFDLILLDEVFKIGPFDGLDTYRKIRSLNPSIPVIMMTGYSDVEEHITQAIQEGAFKQVIKKPSTIAEITEVVGNCLMECNSKE